MARSIHTTKRDLEEIKRADYSDIKRYAAERHKIARERYKKRIIKKQVRNERIKIANPLPPIAHQPLPIRLRDESEFVHFPANIEDIIGVAQCLPCSMLDGITMIDLCLGADEQGHSPESDGAKQDPFTKRFSYELAPGIFNGRYLGSYWRRNARICIYAYVYKPDIPHRDVIEFYLKLQMLATFVHEVAHHYDAIMRVAHGRWLYDSHNKMEIYAEANQHEWVQEVVIAYLEQNYPDQIKLMDEWILHHGGISVPLSYLVSDPRTTVKNSHLVTIRFEAQEAFESLLDDVLEGESLLQTRLEFARQLHYSEHYDQALQIIDLISSEAPSNLTAMALKAEIFEHQAKYKEAKSLAEYVVAQDENQEDAWHVLSNVYEELNDWSALIIAVTVILEKFESRTAIKTCLLLSRAKAYLRMNTIDASENDIEEALSIEWKKLRPPWIERRISELRNELEARKLGN